MADSDLCAECGMRRDEHDPDDFVEHFPDVLVGVPKHVEEAMCALYHPDPAELDPEGLIAAIVRLSARAASWYDLSRTSQDDAVGRMAHQSWIEARHDLETAVTCLRRWCAAADAAGEQASVLEVDTDAARGRGEACD